MKRPKPVVLILDEKELAKLETQYHPVIRDSSTHIIRYPRYEFDTDPVAEIIERKGLLQPRTMLLRNPYRANDYVQISDARDKFSIEKCRLIILTCQRLGAVSVTIHSKFFQDAKNRTELGLNVSVPEAATVETDVKYKAGQSLNAEFSLVAEFEGSQPDVQAAKDLLEKHDLHGDRFLQDLIELRSFAGNQNRLNRTTISLAQEVDMSLGVAAKVNIPAHVSVGASFKVETAETSRYNIEIEALFVRIPPRHPEK